MTISATIKNSYRENEANVSTLGNEKSVILPSGNNGFGSGVNGGELLFLALATCFCNDVYREANRRKINVSTVEVAVSGDFGKEGEPAGNIRYQVHIESPDTPAEHINDLIRHVDTVAEVHNTLRQGVSVSLSSAI